MSLRSPVDKLAQILNRRDRENATHVPTRVVGRLGDGRGQFQALNAECIQTAPLCGVYVGQLVDRPCRPPFTMQGGAGLAMLSNSRQSDTIDVQSVTPDFYPGAVLTATITGRGFQASFAINFLDYDGGEGGRTLFPGLTIADTRRLSATEAEVDVVVSADAELRYDEDGNFVPLPITFDNVGLTL